MSTITLRNTKGSPLTNTEIDDNFSNLNTDKYESGDSPSFAGLTVASDDSYAIDVSRLSAGNTTLRITGGSTAGNDAVLRADIANTTGTSAVYFGDTDTNGIGRIMYEHNGDYMRFYTSSAEAMRIDDSGHVGIGTTAPTAPLTVAGNIATDKQTISSWGATNTRALELTTYGAASSNDNVGTVSLSCNAYESADDSWNRVAGTSASLYQAKYTGDHVWYSTGSGSAGSAISWSERMRIDSSGYVGIGTSSPSNQLEVVGTIRVTNTANAANNSNIRDSGGLVVESGNSNPLYFYTASSEVMRIDSSGNVGIGTSSPAEPLHVIGTVRSNTSSTGDFNFYATSTGGGAYRIYPDDATTANPTWLYQSNSSEDQAWVIGGTERMRIDSSGDVGIGTSSPSYNLHVSKSSDSVNVMFEGGATAGNNSTLRIAIQNTTGTSGIYFADSDQTGAGRVTYEHSDDSMRFFTSNNEEMRLEADGDLHVDGDVIAYSTTISDSRLKEDIQNIEGALEKVNNINGVTFVRKNNGERSAGVIAQELLEVLPEAVKEKELALQTADGESYYVVEYDAVTGLLVEAIKELTKRVEALES